MYPLTHDFPDPLVKLFAIMAKSLAKAPETFGTRLRRFRAASGFTLEQLGRKVGMSKRMVAYYEIQGGTPSPEQLAAFAKALGVSADQLVGATGAQAADAPRGGGEMRLWRRLRQIQQLPEDQRRAVLKVLDGLLGKTHSDAA
jgi:transcriptional regulator with XRE-family HTH domain